MKPRTKKWWVIALALGVIVLIGLVILRQWKDPQVSAPFDVDEFLAPEYFENDRAPAAYRDVFSKMFILNKYGNDLYSNEGVLTAEEIKLYEETAELAAELIEAGKRKPGVWSDTRVSSITGPMDEVQTMRSAARMLNLRVRVQLAQNKPQEALESILACLQLGRHAAFRGTMIRTLVGFAIEGIALEAFNQWTDHEQVTPEMILNGLSQVKSLQPNRPTHSDILQGEYPLTIRSIEDPNSTAVGPGGPRPKNIFISTGMSFFGLAGERPVNAYNLLMADRLSWIQKPAWQRVQWERTLTGPKHLNPDIPEVDITRSQLDDIVAKYKLIQLMMPALESATVALDRETAQEALIETRAALIAFRKRTGTYPKRLEELVPDYLQELPLDYFTGKPLLLAAATKDLHVEADSEETGTEAIAPAITAGQKVLYSIGEEKLNIGDAGWLNEFRLNWYVFPLPLIEK